MPERTTTPANSRPAPMSDGALDAGAMFLSPRVLDRAAFESYSTRLRELAEALAREASAANESLQASQQVGRAIRESSTHHREQIEAGNRLLQDLTQKSADFEAMLAKASDMAGTAARFEREADRIIALRISTLEKRLTETMEGFVRQVQAQMESKARQMGTVLEEMKAARDSIRRLVEEDVANALSKLTDACHRAESLTGISSGCGDAADASPKPGSLGDLIGRAGDASHRAGVALEQFEVIEKRAEESVRGFAAALTASIQAGDRLLGERSSTENALQAAIEDARSAEQSLSERAGEAARVFRPLSELKKTAEDTAARLRALVNEAETSRSGAAHTANELRSIADRLASVVEEIRPWREVLIDGLPDGGLPAPIAQLIGGIRAEIASDLSRMAAAMTLIASRSPGEPVAQAHNANTPRVVVRPCQPSSASPVA